MTQVPDTASDAELIDELADPQEDEDLLQIAPDLAYAIASEEVLAQDWLSSEDEDAWRDL